VFVEVFSLLAVSLLPFFAIGIARFGMVQHVHVKYDFVVAWIDSLSECNIQSKKEDEIISNQCNN
jgi:hypothetical protein